MPEQPRPSFSRSGLGALGIERKLELIARSRRRRGGTRISGRVRDGKGVELVLTLGTGLGSALFADGHLVANLELGHHPFKKGETYEDRVRDAELKKLGKKEWSKRVHEALETLMPIFNPRVLHLGGGNAQHIKGKLPSNVRLFGNVDGMTGGIRLWTDS